MWFYQTVGSGSRGLGIGRSGFNVFSAHCDLAECRIGDEDEDDTGRNTNAIYWLVQRHLQTRMIFRPLLLSTLLLSLIVMIQTCWDRGGFRAAQPAG